MLFLVACVYDEGVYETSFRVAEAASRLAVAAHIVEDSDIWSTFLHDAQLYDPTEFREANSGTESKLSIAWRTGPLIRLGCASTFGVCPTSSDSVTSCRTTEPSFHCVKKQA